MSPALKIDLGSLWSQLFLQSANDPLNIPYRTKKLQVHPVSLHIQPLIQGLLQSAHLDQCLV